MIGVSWPAVNQIHENLVTIEMSSAHWYFICVEYKRLNIYMHAHMHPYKGMYIHPLMYFLCIPSVRRIDSA